MFTKTKAIWFFLVILSFAALTTSSDADANSYILGPGDQLRISVWGHSELTTQAQVRPDGYVTFPLVGDRMADGLTPQELSRDLQQLLGEFVVDPQVTVEVTKFRTIHVQVLGEVKSPGFFSLEANSRMMDAIGIAGGGTTNADFSKVSLIRAGYDDQQGELANFNLERFIDDGQLAENPRLRTGDVIHVTEAGKAVVLGEVRNPGSFIVTGDTDLLDLIVASGGTSEHADLERVVVTRNVEGKRQEIPVNLSAYMAGRHPEPFFMQPDDTLFVPAKRQVIVLGEVQAAGSYPLNKGERLLDVLGKAGGVTPLADGSQISITRTIDSEQSILAVNAANTLRGRAGGDNPELIGGDIVFVPEGRNNVLVLGEVRRPGSYTLTESDQVLDLLAEAGGATPQASLERVTLTRETTEGLEVSTLNIDDMQRGTARGVRLQGGDVLFVPEGSPEALVLGRVRNPGNYRVHQETRILDLIASAGGTLDNAGTKLLLTRDGQTEEIDLGVLTRLGLGNQRVRPQDVLYITEGQQQVLVLGEVRNPGYHRLSHGDRVLDGVALAGGLLESAASNEVTVTRQTDEETEVFAINVDELMNNRFVSNNMPLKGGDIIIVPKANRSVLVLGEVRSPGSYIFDEGDRLLDVVARAGGVNRGALTSMVRLSRQAEEGVSTSSFDLNEAMEGDNQHNPVIAGGDVVYIPEGRNQVLVFGEVSSPGYYQIDSNSRILDAVAMAGGLKERADGSQATLTWDDDQGTRMETLDITHIMETGEGNRRLQGGEMLLIPEANLDVLVMGEVARPGMYSVRPGEKILDILAKAGGPSSEGALTEATLTRSSTKEVHQIDITSLLENSNEADNIKVQGGDVLFIPQAYRRVLVLGEVQRPGAYEVDDETRILDILATAGGPSNQADLTEATLTRRANDQVYSVDLEALMQDSNHSENRAVQGGDILYVPQAFRRVLILGQVQRPGAYDIDGNSRLLDVVATAGGPTDRADLGQATLTRLVQGDEEVIPLDLAKILDNQRENPRLAGGDVIHLPEARQVVIMGEVSRPGSYRVPQGGRLLDVLALAGGLNSSLSTQELVMTRQSSDGEQVWQFNYGELMNNQQTTNLLVAGGDVIFVPEGRRQVLVLGEVARPGVYTISQGDRILDALAQAGGPTNRAALEAVGIYRGGDVDAPDTLVIGQDKMLFEGDVNENPPIQGGDIIYVPETNRPDWSSIFGFLSGVRTFQQIIDWFK